MNAFHGLSIAQGFTENQLKIKPAGWLQTSSTADRFNLEFCEYIEVEQIDTWTEGLDIQQGRERPQTNKNRTQPSYTYPP